MECEGGKVITQERVKELNDKGEGSRIDRIEIINRRRRCTKYNSDKRKCSRREKEQDKIAVRMREIEREISCKSSILGK